MENVFRDEKFYFVHPPRNSVIKVISKSFKKIKCDKNCPELSLSILFLITLKLNMWKFEKHFLKSRFSIFSLVRTKKIANLLKVDRVCVNLKTKWNAMRSL